jgi:RiboL-PSP-HEPN
VSPLSQFDAVWERCGQLSVIHAYLAKNLSSALSPDELLRSEWVARVSALDLYVHELVSQRMLAIFESRVVIPRGYAAFKIPVETMNRIRVAATPPDASAAFDFEVRRQLGLLTFQHPDNIAEGIRLCSDLELWNTIALELGATESQKHNQAKILKGTLSRIVERRNKIAHEGDLKPGLPRTPWPITQHDISTVTEFIEKLVRTMNKCLV